MSRLTDEQLTEVGHVVVGNLTTMNQDEYLGLGDWWVQIRMGHDHDEVLARVYGNSPRQANERAAMIAEAIAAHEAKRSHS